MNKILTVVLLLCGISFLQTDFRGKGNIAGTTVDDGSTGTTTSNAVTGTSFNAASDPYKNRSDIVDVVADCGARGAGAACDGTLAKCHDDHSVIQQCINNNPARTILFPKLCFTDTSCVDYYSSQQLVVHTSRVTLKGAASASYWPVQIKFASGSGGVLLYSYTGIEDLFLNGSDGWDRTNLTTYILPSGLGGSGPAVDGLVVGGQAIVRNVRVTNFARHCIAMDSHQTGGSDETDVQHVWAFGCRGDGINYSGLDSQVGHCTLCVSEQNQLYGFRETGAYGNVLIQPTTQLNHSANAGTQPLAGTIQSVVVSKDLATVTMGRPNTLLAGDLIRLSGMLDTGLDGSRTLTAVTSTTFSFPYVHADESLGVGGRATYDLGVHIWAQPGNTVQGKNAAGGNFYTPLGVLINPYSECNESTGSFTTASSSALVVGRLGCAPSDGVTLEPSYNTLKVNSTVQVIVPKSPAVVRFNYDPDYYGKSPLIFANADPTNPLNTTYSNLIWRRKGYAQADYGNGSGWWCGHVGGASDGTGRLCDVGLGDRLTDAGRSNLKGAGQASFFNGFYVGGNYQSPATYVGACTTAPTSGSWVKSDFCINSNPSAGHPWGWQCMESGTPGRWVPLIFGGAPLSTPANSSAACTAGQIWADTTYLYACTATNTIKRIPLSTF
jgi:hypothetical protein